MTGLGAGRAGTTLAKLGLLGSLYFSQGLPFGFFTQALPVLLRQRGASLADIGLSSLLALPWALKFVWAPLVDRFAWSRLGRRKSWILPLQFGSLAILLALALAGTRLPMAWLLAAVLSLNLLAATQDIATDGLAVDSLSASERGFANGVQVAGYRVGMIVGGGALLIWHQRLGFSGTFLAMALLLAVATLPVLLSAEPPAPAARTPGSSRLPHFLRRPGAARLLALLLAYKGGDAFATSMLRPFLTDTGLGLESIGWLLGTLGFSAGLLGALCGGALMNRFERKRALIGFGLLQAASVAGYASLALGQPSLTALSLACGAEYFAGGMATAALFTCMMDWCSREESGLDYTVQASAVVIATGAASACAGFSAQHFGYFAHFCLALGLSLLGLAFVARSFPSRSAAAALRGEQGESLCE